ncbi:hypothetical protein KM295_15600 [Natronomonas sp. F2-12]|jgi:hypothetical protein|uniref:Uncharacterized protein n=1 Tax=Natronomonas aquatica TaxID=2841590 RepID=A0A9R1CVY9_9EURY|nr:hypothetical protein [Natronomonas aquatica]MCQ4334880.1 hypothetical protein [Natronomonas aquatica]
MDSEQSVNSFIQIYEFLPTDDVPLDEPLTVTFTATNHDQDWTVVLNADPKAEHNVEDVPVTGSTTTVRSTQALIFLGQQHAGVMGVGAGEFYDDQFDTPRASLGEEFMNDFTDEFA